VTPDQIIYQRRMHVLALADELGNVAEACRLVGVSRTSFTSGAPARRPTGSTR
jgi:hypothetical protein